MHAPPFDVMLLPAVGVRSPQIGGDVMPDAFDTAKSHDEKAQRLRDQGSRRETRAGRTADKNTAIWLRDQAGALYAEAAIEFEIAAAYFLDAHQNEDAERAYADAAECWSNAADSWQSPHDKAWAYEMAASDLAAQATYYGCNKDHQ